MSGPLDPVEATPASPLSLSAFSRSDLPALAVRAEVEESGSGPSGLARSAVEPNDTFRGVVAVVGHANRHVDDVRVRDFQRQLRIDAERLRASMVLVTAPMRPSSVCPATST